MPLGLVHGADGVGALNEQRVQLRFERRDLAVLELRHAAEVGGAPRLLEIGTRSLELFLDVHFALHGGLFGLPDLFEIGERRAVYVGVKPSAGVRWGDSFFAWDHGAIAWRGTAAAGVRF